jgi:hypothetical protein
VIDRKCSKSKGLLKITGRDVDENEYGVKIAQPHGWTLISDSLNEAAQAARTMIATTNLGDHSAEVIMLAGFKPDGIRAADVGGDWHEPQKRS